MGLEGVCLAPQAEKLSGRNNYELGPNCLSVPGSSLTCRNHGTGLQPVTHNYSEQASFTKVVSYEEHGLVTRCPAPT